MTIVLQSLHKISRFIANTARSRYYHLILKNVGQNLLISKHVIVSGPHNLSIGNNVFINLGCILHAEGGLSIGDDTKIGPYTTIWTTNHIFERTDVLIRMQGLNFAPVLIGPDVWIGASVTILAGVKIGEGAVIGAGAVVTKDVAPYVVAVGNPAQVVKTRLK